MSKRPGDPGYADGWCIHYRYNHSRSGEPNTCEAGIDYSVWEGLGHQSRPCFLDKGLSRPGAAHCPSLRLPTREEIRAHEEWLEERQKVMITVFDGIASWRKKNKGRSVAETVQCPACGGRLRLSISSYNGHVHGHCETEGCVSWME